MEIFVTGLPGASKSLNTIYEVCRSENIGEVPIYYNNIKYLLLDYSVCESFAGWLFGVHFKNGIDKVSGNHITRIHKTGRLVNEDDFPHLINHYEIWFQNRGPLTLWVNWVKVCYKNNSVVDCIVEQFTHFPDLTFNSYKGFNLHWEHFKDPYTWFLLPSPSKIIIDECQKYFPPRSTGSKVPQHISEFETHRHTGTDIYLITQDIRLVDVNLRRLCNLHIHFVNLLGSTRVRRLEHMRAFDTEDYHDKKSADSKIITRPKHLYGVYFSSVFHTHTLRIPKKLVYAFGLLLLLITICFYMYSNFSNRAETASAASQKANSQVNSLPTGGSIQSPKPLPTLKPSYKSIDFLSSFFGCQKIRLAGSDYVQGIKQFYLACDYETKITHTIGQGEDSEPFSYDYNEMAILDSFDLYNIGFVFYQAGDRLFIRSDSDMFYVGKI